MLVLALDTTARAGSTAVLRDDQLLAVIEGDASRTHGERLPGELAAALAAATVDRTALELLVVASGPGAFTGLRIGLAAIQGLAMVLEIPVVGVSALDAWAYTAWRELGVSPQQLVAVWMDAQRGEVFCAPYRLATGPNDIPIAQLAEPTVAAPEDTLAALERTLTGDVTFVGDGARRYQSLIRERRGQWRVLDQQPALAPALARLGLQRAAEGHAGPPHALQPLYVRRPDAERDRERQGWA